MEGKIFKPKREYKRVSQREKWRNIINYIVATEDIIETHGLTYQEQLEETEKRYKWLESTYNVTFRNKKSN